MSASGDTVEQAVSSGALFLFSSLLFSFPARAGRRAEYPGTIMAREFAKAFYRSTEWETCRAAYMHSVGYLCERCKAKGIIRTGDTVHHKIHLSPANISDPSVTLNWDNLECVCRDCHAELHRNNKKRYRFRPDGTLYVPPYA